MSKFLEYDELVKRSNQAPVAGFAILLAALSLLSFASAQVNGAPASVTSLGFGGHPGRINGVPASVTSLGPRGYTPGRMQTPGSVPLFGVNQGNINDHPHHRPHGYVYPYAYGYYSVPYYYDNGYDSSADVTSEQYNGGPTIFDRRGPGSTQASPSSSSGVDNSNTAEQPVASNSEPPAPDIAQPSTVLIFKDAHRVEVENYAIVGDMLYDLSGGRRHKIALSDLDLTATVKANDDRGVDFTLPTNGAAN